MHQAGFRPDDLRKMRQKGDDVVLHFALDGVDARDVEAFRPGTTLFPDRFRRFFWDDAQVGHGLRGMGLDFEPDAVFLFRRPDRRHFGAG